MTVRRRAGLRAVAVVAPVAATAAAVGVREFVANTSVALMLVLVVVAIAAGGDRVAGLLAALASAAAFDFFLTVPYLTFAILGRDDVETAVLLLAIGVAVTEISLWGRRHRAGTRRVQGYLADVATAARMGADGRFLLTASTRLRRPSLEQLLVAVTLAEQVTRTRVER